MSVNKVILVGNLGRDPEARTMQSGDDLPGKAIAGAQTLMTPAQQQTALAPLGVPK